MCCCKTKTFFSGEAFITYLKDGESVKKQMGNLLNQRKMKFPWKLLVSFTTKTRKDLCVHLVLWMWPAAILPNLWIKYSTVSSQISIYSWYIKYRVWITVEHVLVTWCQPHVGFLTLFLIFWCLPKTTAEQKNSYLQIRPFFVCKSGVTRMSTISV